MFKWLEEKNDIIMADDESLNNFLERKFTDYVLAETQDTIHKFNGTINKDDFCTDLFEKINDFGSCALLQHSRYSEKIDRSIVYFSDGLILSNYDEYSGFWASITTTNKKKLKLFKSLFPKENVRKFGSVDMIVSGQGGPQFQSLGSVYCKLERLNYSSENLSDYDYVIDQLQSDNPKGRLSVVDGPPGTGKTFLMKSLIGEMKDLQVVIIPSKFVGELDSPGLIPLLMRKTAESGGKPIILIVEDADKILVPRSAGNMSAISSLLNYTDGIFGSAFNLRIVATTNAYSYEMDSALLRPGRLIKRMTVGKLDVDRANKVYQRLTGGLCNKFDEPVTLAEVYAEAHGVSVDTVDNGKKEEKKISGFGR